MRFFIALVALLLPTLTFSSEKSSPIRIGLIEELSGPFSAVGHWTVRHLQIAIDGINQRGGVLGGRKLELVKIDGKGDPKDAVLALHQATDNGLRFITQGSGSAVASALSAAIDKHNTRNPHRSVLFLNYMAGDPALTNERCNFWHFRFEAHLEVKMRAFTQYIAGLHDVKAVYLFNQDYSWGHGVARMGRQMLASLRPDIRIVGDDLIPLGKVKDFAPYAAKIKASGADSVITGNWGNDLNLLLKAGKSSDLPVKYYAIFGHELGAPTVIGAAGSERLVQVSPWHANLPRPEVGAFVRDYWRRYKASHNDDPYYASIRIAMDMLTKAIEQSKSDDPLAVANALRGMRHVDHGESVWMRPDDHQLVQPLYISTFAPVDGEKVKFDLEGTGYGFRTEQRFNAADIMTPTTCRMSLPEAR